MARLTRAERRQLLQDIENIRRDIDSEQQFDQDTRAERVRRVDDLLKAAVVSGDRELHSLAAEVFHKAVTAAYPPGFWEDFYRLRDGDPAGLERAVRFLEADPWFFRSGYVKADLLRFIKRTDLSPAYRRRLRRVLLAAVSHRDRREFRYYCRLARTLDDPELRQALAQRLTDSDAGVRRRARWMLEALEQPEAAS